MRVGICGEEFPEMLFIPLCLRSYQRAISLCNSNMFVCTHKMYMYDQISYWSEDDIQEIWQSAGRIFS